ncbi:MAG: hypothetical protein WD904_09390 [Dehalococcoidia bacterium]
MIDFNSSHLAVRTVREERAREVRRLSHGRAVPGLRAWAAAKFARLAMSLDRETAGDMIGRDRRTAGR